MKSILIIGCGWLGKITAKLLINSGYSVTGTTRDADKFETLSELGISPVILDIKHGLDSEIPKTDVVIISIPPKRTADDGGYVKAIMAISLALSKANNQVIMCSSTSVYNECSNIVVENDLISTKDHSNIIVSAEATLRELLPHSTILRLGGLYGYHRHPVYFLSGRKQIPNGDAPVNLVHGDDVASIIQKIIEQEIKGEVFNVVAPSHPTRKQVYGAKAKEFNLDPPSFLAGGKDSKKVDCCKLIQTLDYRFIYNNPLDTY